MKAYLALAIIRFFGLFPFGLLQWLGGGLGRLLWLTNSRMAKVARRNIEACFPELSEEEQLAMAKTSIIETGRSLMETGKIWTWGVKSGSKRVLAIHGEEHLDKARAENKGVIWITMHHGNWEMLRFFFVGRSHLTTMYKPSGLTAFDKWMTESREKFGVHMVEASRQGVMSLIQQAKKNEDVMLLPDQEPSRKSGVFAPFFEVPALTGKLTTHLALANPDMAVIYIYVMRVKGGFEINLVPAEESLATEDFELSATRMNQDLKRCIMDRPEYFQWGYKRFKQRPEGEPKFYQGF